MKTGLFIGAVVLLYAIETTVFSSLSMWGIRPDLVLVLVCAAALSQGWREGTVAGFVAGMIVDVIDGQFVGLGAASKAFVGGGVGRIGQVLYGGNAFVPVMVVLGASVLEHAVYLVGLRLFGLQYPLVDGLVRILLPAAWYDALAGVVIYPLLAFLVQRVVALNKDRGVGSTEA